MNRTQFLFSPKTQDHKNVSYLENEKKGCHENREHKFRLHDIASKDKISHEKMYWQNEENELDFYDVGNFEDYNDFEESENSDVCSFPSSSSLEMFDMKITEDLEKRRHEIISGKWGGYGLHLRLWDEVNAPVTKITDRENLILNSTEFCGILTDRLIGACSSFLTVSPENGQFILSKCVLNKLKLKDISILRYHRYLQYLDLSHNNITDLSPLGEIPHLMFLNASHNKIKKLLAFNAPLMLTYVDLSFNEIDRMVDLTEFWSIVRLDLSHNAIENICGLHKMRYLRYLNLSYNLIETVSNLDDLLNIQELNLEYNYITSFKSINPESGINILPNLRTLFMGHNRLSTLDFFQGAYGLRLIDLKYNKISDLLEVTNLRSLVYEVDLRGNPCTKWPNYKDVLLFSMPSVKYMDGSEVTVAEKVSASTLFNPPVDLLAARSISKLVLLEQLSMPRIESVVPYDVASPPLIILSGPSAVKKVTLGIRIAEKLDNRVRWCRSHTTREMPEEEDESKAYYFLTREEFNEKARRGEFLSIQELLGNSYGFHTSEITAMRLENKIGVTQMDLNATIQMTKSYQNVKPILVITNSEKIHREWINEKFHIFTWIKDSVENLLAVKIGRNIVTESPETSDSRIEFINDLINEVINNIELSKNGFNVTPEGLGATNSTINESQMYLPRATITGSQIEMEGKKKHIKFRSESETEEKQKDVDEVLDQISPGSSDLRVILDEYSNIIIDDEETKRKRKKAKILYKQNLLKNRTEENENVFEDLTDSSSSTESIQAFPERKIVDPEHLKNMYIDLVLKSRKIYIQQHRKKPGFFSYVIFTDNFESAYNRFVEIIRETDINRRVRKATSIPEIEYLRKFVIPEKAKKIAKEMRDLLSTPKTQRKVLMRTHGVTSWKDVMPSQMAQYSQNKGEDEIEPSNLDLLL